MLSLVFGILLLPFMLLRFLLKLVLGLLLVPVVLMVTIVGLVVGAMAVAFALVIPLLPAGLLLLILWMVFRRRCPAATAAPGS
jgi:hypothetical protein